MIPDSFLQVARRWLWLILLCAVLGAAAGYALLPGYFGASTTYESSTALGVSRYVSLSRIVTAGEPNFDDDQVIADYTESIAMYAQTAQFRDEVRQRLNYVGVSMDADTIAKNTAVTANRTLFRIEVIAKAGSPEVAEALATASGAALTDKAQSDEDVVAWTLLVSLEQQRQDLSQRIELLDEERTLTAAGAGTREERLVTLEYHAVDNELGEATRQREELILNRSFGGPLQQVLSPQTIEGEAHSLETTDLMLVGALAGLVLGWLAANVAERFAGSNRAATPDVVIYGGATAEARLRRLLEKASELEHRARALPELEGPRDPH